MEQPGSLGPPALGLHFANPGKQVGMQKPLLQVTAPTCGPIAQARPHPPQLELSPSV